MKKPRVSYCKRQTLNIGFLHEDHTVEVHVGEIDGVDAIYEMVVHKIDEENRTVEVFFWDDPKQELHTVTFMQIAPVRSPLRNITFKRGETVEVKYRVDDSSPWGWWIGTISDIIYFTDSTKVEQYEIEFPDGEKIQVGRHLVRRNSFY